MPSWLQHNISFTSVPNSVGDADQERHICLCAISSSDFKASLPRLHRRQRSSTAHLEVKAILEGVRVWHCERLAHLLRIDGNFSVRSSLLKGLVQYVCPRLERSS